MTYDLANFDNPDFLMQCCYPEDNINIADEFVILFNRIGTIILIFCTKNFKEKIFFSRVYYCNRLDTKLISLKMLYCKGLSFFSSDGILEIQDRKLPIMLGYLITYNLYKINYENIATNLVTIF